MSRRKFISLVRVLLSLLVIAAMGSSRVISFAGDYDQTLISVEESEQAVYEKGDFEALDDESTTEIPLEENLESEYADEASTDASDEGNQINISESKIIVIEIGGSEEYSAGPYTEDVCFYIRGGIDAEIPYEPAPHSSANYSDAMRVNNAVKYTGTVLGQDLEYKEDNLDEDGYTIKNEVTTCLLARPTLEQIQEVAPLFDPAKHYIVWYVIKSTTTAAPNADVGVHVDGVIRSRIYSQYGDNPTEPTEPEPGENPIDEPIEEPVEETVSSDYSFNIYTKNFAEPFEYDGQEHIIGGYVIEVLDKETGELLQEFDYGPFGNRLGMRMSFRTEGKSAFSGTVFSFAGATYKVNVDSAYLSVTEPGLYSIPFLSGGKEISLDDIRIWDESGKLIDTGISKNPKGGSDKTEVSKRSITVTAGSTVQNDDGQTLTNDKVSITSGSLIEGHKLVTTIVGSQTGPGTSLNEITSYDIVDENGNSVKKFYNVSLVNGQLVLVPVSGEDSNGTNSTGSAVTSILVRDQEKTTVDNKPMVLGAQRDGDGKSDSIDGQRAHGVRSSETSDEGIPSGARLSLIILCVMIIMVINIKRNKQN